MNLWRLEWLRLVRTRRLLALVGAYVFFGLLGPLTARYIGEIVARFGGDVQVIFPDPVPADGIAQFVSNASQIGVLVAVAVAAGALVVDALPEMSIFLRTRVVPARRILVPRFVVATGAICAAYVVGLLVAWYETWALLGGMPVGGLLAGALLQLVYLAFVVAVVALLGSRSRNVVGTVGVAVVILLLLPTIGVVDSIGRWLPSHLVGAQLDMVVSGSFIDYLPAVVVSLTGAAIMLWSAGRVAGTKEL